MRNLAATVSLAVLLTACGIGPAVGPNYKAPAFLSPTTWLNGGSGITQSTEAANPAWWSTFNDATLTMLVGEAVKNNASLRIAQANLAEARAQRLSTIAALLPSVDGVAQGQRGTLTTGGVGNTSSAGFQASWELDLFGGTRRAGQAARAGVQAAEASLANTHIALMAEVAQTYLSVRQLQQQIALTSRNLGFQKETLRIVNVQFREGVVDQFDVSRAEAQVETTAAQLPALQQLLVANMGNLGILVGAQPAEIQGMIGQPTDAALENIPLAAGSVLLNAPAAVLANRPDVAVAERQLAAATANVGVAMSNWFPRIGLAGLFGVGYTPVAGSAEAWNVGGTVSLPLINFGSVRALVNTSRARQAAALATYEQTVLAALADVETSLSGYVTSQQQYQRYAAATEANRTAVRLARARYQEGTTSLLDVLTSEQALLASEINTATARASVGQAYAGLYRALGGGRTTQQ